MSKIKYFKNFILCGDLGYRCLLCKENCANEEKVERHLRWERHRKALKNQNCMPQFGTDYIYKLDPYYYCTCCNRTMKDIAEIKQHIASDMHKNYKSNPATATAAVEVKLVDDGVMIQSTLITHFQWHGIIDKQCVLCNVVVTNFGDHVYNGDHVVRLLQTRVNYVDDKYYRKIDKHTFQCFTCKKTFPIHNFDNHFSNHSNNNVETSKPLHQNDELRLKPAPRFDKDGNELKDCTMGDKNQNYPTVLCGTGMEKIRNTEWDIQMLAGINDDFFIIDMTAKKLTCKVCKLQIKVVASEVSGHLYKHGFLSYSFSPVMKRINSHIDQNYIQRNYDHGAARSKVAQYGKENFIKMNAGGSKGYCTLCDKFLSPNIDVFKHHTAGCYHKGHLELKGIIQSRKHERGSYKPVYIMELIKTLSYSADKKQFLINGDLLISEDSFFLLKRIEHGKNYKKTKCFACEETMSPEEEKEHCISWKHKSKLLAAQCISDDRLPIREIRPRLYHCSVCNESLPYWESLKKHSKQITHNINLKECLAVFVKMFGFSKTIVLKTNNDNLYMQLLNAVYNTKYIIKFDS